MRKLTNRNLILSIALGLLVPLAVLASNLTIPNVFSPGTPIQSSQVNANFAAVQTAVNSKLDSSAAVLKSGTRIQIVGYRTADGLAVPAGSGFFDSTLGTYCNPTTATDLAVRCLPSVAPNFKGGGSGEGKFADSLCSQQLYVLNNAPVTPGWPQQTVSYLTSSGSADSGYLTVVHTAVAYSGPVYERSESYSPDSGYQVTCSAADGGTALFSRGPAVAPTTFAEFIAATF